MLCMITTPVVMCIKSNIALSMGMVGALSIVRFRTAVKDPLDTAYMFWSLTMGILLGAELYTIALVVVAGISIAMLALAFFRLRTPNTFLLVTHYDAEVEPEVMDFIRRIKVQRLRSKTVTPGGVELTVEVQLRERFDIVNKLDGYRRRTQRDADCLPVRSGQRRSRRYDDPQHSAAARAEISHHPGGADRLCATPSRR